MKKFYSLVLLAVMASLVLGACMPSTPAPLSAEEQAALIANAVNKAVQTAMAPTTTPTPDGSWGTQAATATLDSTQAPSVTPLPPTGTPTPVFTPTLSGEDQTNLVLETAQANASVVPLTCITTAQAKETLGLDVQRLEEEPCAWVARDPNKIGFSVKAPAGWQLTVTVKNGDAFVVFVYYGQDGLVLENVTAVTARKLSGFDGNDAVHVPCLLLAKEQAFGQREVNPFSVYPGNFTCSK